VIGDINSWVILHFKVCLIDLTVDLSKGEGKLKIIDCGYLFVCSRIELLQNESSG